MTPIAPRGGCLNMPSHDRIGKARSPAVADDGGSGLESSLPQDRHGDPDYLRIEVLWRSVRYEHLGLDEAVQALVRSIKDADRVPYH